MGRNVFDGRVFPGELVRIDLLDAGVVEEVGTELV